MEDYYPYGQSQEFSDQDVQYEPLNENADENACFVPETPPLGSSFLSSPMEESSQQQQQPEQQHDSISEGHRFIGQQTGPSTYYPNHFHETLGLHIPEIPDLFSDEPHPVQQSSEDGVSSPHPLSAQSPVNSLRSAPELSHNTFGPSPCTPVRNIPQSSPSTPQSDGHQFTYRVSIPYPQPRWPNATPTSSARRMSLGVPIVSADIASSFSYQPLCSSNTPFPSQDASVAATVPDEEISRWNDIARCSGENPSPGSSVSKTNQ